MCLHSEVRGGLGWDMICRWNIRAWVKEGKAPSISFSISTGPKLWRPLFGFFDPMKIALTSLAFLILTFPAVICSGQPATLPVPTPWSVVHREINERTWQRTKYIPSPSGQIVSKIESYKEVGNCICFRGQNGWQDSQDNIRILPDGSGASTNTPREENCHFCRLRCFPGNSFIFRA